MVLQGLVQIACMHRPIKDALGCLVYSKFVVTEIKNIVVQ